MEISSLAGSEKELRNEDGEKETLMTVGMKGRGFFDSKVGRRWRSRQRRDWRNL